MSEYEVGEIPPEELEKQKKRPYLSEFACGFDEAKKLIDDYMKGQYAYAD